MEAAPDRSRGARYALVAGNTKSNHAGRKGEGPDIATAWLAVMVEALPEARNWLDTTPAIASQIGVSPLFAAVDASAAGRSETLCVLLAAPAIATRLCRPFGQV